MYLIPIILLIIAVALPLVRMDKDLRVKLGIADLAAFGIYTATQHEWNWVIISAAGIFLMVALWRKWI